MEKYLGWGREKRLPHCESNSGGTGETNSLRRMDLQNDAEPPSILQDRREDHRTSLILTRLLTSLINRNSGSKALAPLYLLSRVWSHCLMYASYLVPESFFVLLLEERCVQVQALQRRVPGPSLSQMLFTKSLRSCTLYCTEGIYQFNLLQ